jgi:transposase
MAVVYDWAMRIAARCGRARACGALARKLAGILYAMWRDETKFDPQALRQIDMAIAAAAA